jgi:hypothetical protein
MKMHSQKSMPCFWALLASFSLVGARAQTPAPAAESTAYAVKLPAYEVVAPKFTSRWAELYEKIDSLDDTIWVDAKGGALIQAIIWRHGYLRDHPSDEAMILIKQGKQGAVLDATTIYTQNGKLYANSYALGDHVRLGRLTAADIHDTAKILPIIEGIRGQYLLGTALGLAQYRGGSAGEPVLGYLIAAASPEFYQDTGQVAPTGTNLFYAEGLVRTGGALWTYSFDAGSEIRFHEPASERLDAVYRALHNPNQAGLVPVALSPMNASVQTAQGTVSRPDLALVFDWDGIHYVYRRNGGTTGHPIPSNPVTGLPYLCVRDSGLIESIYFTATYLKDHPGEKAVVVSSDAPGAAFTANGKLCLFSPSLNNFALLAKTDAHAIEDPTALRSSLARVRVALATISPSSAGKGHPSHILEELPGDTPDLQMRRIFVAFQAAGIPARLQSGETSSLHFTWQGLNYVYGPDQRLRLASNG